jgi:acyl-CoA thioesterase
MRLVEVHDDGLTMEIPLRDDLKNLAGQMHGGVLATLVDAAAGMATHRQLGGRHPITTVEFKINYFRPISSGSALGRARVLRLGKTLSVVQVDLFDSSQKLAGTALVTYMILPDAAYQSRRIREEDGAAIVD